MGLYEELHDRAFEVVDGARRVRDPDMEAVYRLLMLQRSALYHCRTMFQQYGDGYVGKLDGATALSLVRVGSDVGGWVAA